MIILIESKAAWKVASTVTMTEEAGMTQQEHTCKFRTARSG